MVLCLKPWCLFLQWIHSYFVKMLWHALAMPVLNLISYFNFIWGWIHTWVLIRLGPKLQHCFFFQLVQFVFTRFYQSTQYYSCEEGALIGRHEELTDNYFLFVCLQYSDVAVLKSVKHKLRSYRLITIIRLRADAERFSFT